MGGINDISKAFRAAVGPGIELRAVRMGYDNAAGDQVFEFDVADKDGPRTIWQRAGANVLPQQIVAMAVASAHGAKEQLPNIGPKVEDFKEQLDKVTGISDRQLGLMSAVEPVGDAIEQIKRGEYELVDDGVPPPKPALFF